MRIKGSLWFWVVVWGASLCIGPAVFVLYAWLPADGATGDLESFLSEGFRVQWLLDERPGGLQPEDLIVRAGGHTVDEWLAGAPRGPEWRSEGGVPYDILRDGQPLTLEIRLAPVPLRAILDHWAAQLLGALAFFLVGSYVFWKASHEPAARLLMLFCSITALQYCGDAYNFQYATLPWRWPFWLHLAYEHGMYSLSIAAICTFALAFPIPHPAWKRFPRLVPLLLFGSQLLAIAVAMLLSPSWSAAVTAGGDASWVMAMILIGLAIGAGIRSVRLARDPVTRAQILWIVWIAVIGLLFLLPGYVLPLMFGARPLLPHPLIMVILIALPITFGIAILRYRLFDIQVVINRTLVYATLTVLLGGLYLLLVRVLTLAIQSFLHREDDTLVVFVATLSIVLAFAPLRRRIQAVIDHVFYRTKWDYERLLPEMSERLATSIVLDQLAALLARELPERLRIAGAALAVLDPAGERLVPVGERRHPDLPVGHALAADLRRGQPILRLQPPADLPPEAAGFLAQHDVELAVPLLVGPDLVGLYALGPKLSGHAYTREEVHLLHLLGQQAAVAVQNSRLFHAEREQRLLAEALQEAADIVSSTLDLDQVLDRILVQVEKVVAGDAFNIMLLEGNVARVVRHRGYGGLAQASRIADLTLPVADYPTLTQMVQTRKPVVIADTAADPDWVPLEGWDWLRSYVSAPIVVAGEAVGFLNVDRARPVLFSPPDARRLEALARHAATALENAQYYEQAQQEIAERQRAEQELELHAEELERYALELEHSNRELQQFAYIASHDLQEPLRMVTSYVQLLEKRYGGQLDADADEFIAFAVDGARRMQELIRGLLAYSRVGSHAEPFRPSDAQYALDQALANLQVAIRECDAIVTHDPMPTVTADPTQLMQLLQNLIGNALKFRGDRTPEIHVGAEYRDKAWLFSVRDNGIGIEPQYTERIFVIFRRLHTREEYPGAGIGLAICKRIVERHGGRIWVETEPGEGSTFYFTLPHGS
jgi:signal transduction histidine kinase